jgi:hypothetical protein
LHAKIVHGFMICSYIHVSLKIQCTWNLINWVYHFQAQEINGREWQWGNEDMSLCLVVKEIRQENEGNWKKWSVFIVFWFCTNRQNCPSTCSPSFVLYT